MKFSALFFLISTVFASTAPLPRAVPGLIRLRYVNAIQGALSGTVVPRNSVGNASDQAGSMGLNLNRWKVFRGQTVFFMGDAAGNPSRMFPDASMSVALTIRLLDHLPAGTSYLTIDPLGHLSTGVPFDSTLETASSGNFETNTTAPNATPITTSNSTLIVNNTVTMNTYGNPVRMALMSAKSNFNSYDFPTKIKLSSGVTEIGGGRGAVVFFVDGLPRTLLAMGATGQNHTVPCNDFSFVMPLTAGNHTIEAYETNFDSTTMNAMDCKLVVNELF